MSWGVGRAGLKSWGLPLTERLDWTQAWPAERLKAEILPRMGQAPVVRLQIQRIDIMNQSVRERKRIKIMRFRSRRSSLISYPNSPLEWVWHRVDNTHPSREIAPSFSNHWRDEEEFCHRKGQEHPRIKPWRNPFLKWNLGSKFQAHWIHGRRVLKGDPFRRSILWSTSIKPLFEISGPMGAMTGYPQWKSSSPVAEGWNLLRPWWRGDGDCSKGELVYRDDREVLTRNWVWRQCEKDKTTEKTRNLFIPIDVLGEVEEKGRRNYFGTSGPHPRYLGGRSFHPSWVGKIHCWIRFLKTGSDLAKKKGRENLFLLKSFFPPEAKTSPLKKRRFRNLSSEFR